MSFSNKTTLLTGLATGLSMVALSCAPSLAWARTAPAAQASPALPDVEGPSEAPAEAPAGETPPSGSEPYSSELPAPSADAPAPAADVQTQPADQTTAPSAPPPSSEPPPPSLQQPVRVRVAVGLSPELDGSKSELQLLDALESSARSSKDPEADVRRLRVGAAQPRELCREGRDDLIISVGYMPDRSDPVLTTHDCRIDEALGIRAAAAAGDPLLLGVLWDEHNTRVAEGARERRRGRVSPKVRTGIIAGVAVLVVGAAVGLLIAGAVQKESVVLTITPSP